MCDQDKRPINAIPENLTGTGQSYAFSLFSGGNKSQIPGTASSSTTTPYNRLSSHTGVKPSVPHHESSSSLRSSSGQKRGSMPDVSSTGHLQQPIDQTPIQRHKVAGIAIASTTTGIPREEAAMLGSKRRGELIRQQHLDERRRAGDFAVILNDIKVCYCFMHLTY